MRLALDQARLAADHGDVPVGAVVLDPAGAVVAAAGNEREIRHDPTAHAEILALREASRRLRSWRLTGHTLVVTLEPCTMCAGALVLARVARLVFGAYDPKAGAVSLALRRRTGSAAESSGRRARRRPRGRVRRAAAGLLRHPLNPSQQDRARLAVEFNHQTRTIS